VEGTSEVYKRRNIPNRLISLRLCAGSCKVPLRCTPPLDRRPWLCPRAELQRFIMLKTPGLTGSTASALSRAHHPFRLSTSVIPLKTGAPSERLPQFEVHVFNVGVCRRLGCYQCMRVCAGVCAGGKGGRLPPQLLLHSRCPAAQAARAAPATAAAAPSPDSQRSFQVLASPPRALEESNTTQPSQNE